MNFPASRSKVERANKHILDLNELLNTFTKSDFYSVSVKKNKGSNYLFFDIDRTGFPGTDAALITGDAIHNLKSALDLLYYQAVEAATGSTESYTRFPIRDTRENLETALNGGLKKKATTDNPHPGLICDLLMDIVKPYTAGNYPLWALHELNIRDKHQLLIPVFEVMRFMNICLEDDKHISFPEGRFFALDASSSFKLNREGNLTVKNKGNAATAILFNVGIPYASQSVIQALYEIAESVTRAIDAFEMLPTRYR
jgi:hypothetical protein